MSNDPTRPEGLPSDAEYRQTFNRVCDHLIDAAVRLKGGLQPIDITGAMFSVGIEFLRHHEPDKDVVAWIRNLADGLERGEIGIKPQKLN